MKKVRLVIWTIILSGIFVSCHTSKSVSTGWNYNGAFEQTNFSSSGGNKNYSEGFKSEERKILFSAYLSLLVNKPDTANTYIAEIAKKYEGYVNELGTNRTIIRVKSLYLDSAIKDISYLGKIENKNISGQDVTEQFLDFQIRLENAKKARTRYLELLAKAENVEAALKVEKELERLNETIDLLKGKMNRINHLSEFSTITVSLKEKKKPGILGYMGIGIYKSVKWLFVRN